MDQSAETGRSAQKRRFDDLVDVFSQCEDLKTRLQVVEKKLKRFATVEKELITARMTIKDMEGALGQQKQTSEEIKKKGQVKLQEAKSLHQRDVAKLNKTIAEYRREIARLQPPAVEHQGEFQPGPATPLPKHRNLQEIKKAMVALQKQYNAGLDEQKRTSGKDKGHALDRPRPPAPVVRKKSVNKSGSHARRARRSTEQAAR